MKYLKLFENFETHPNISTITIGFSSDYKQNEFQQHFIYNDKKPVETSFLKNDNWSKLKFDSSGLILEKNRNYIIAIVENNVTRDPSTSNLGRNNFNKNSDLLYLSWHDNSINILWSNEHTKTWVKDNLFNSSNFKNSSPEYRDIITGHDPHITCEFKNGLKVGEVDNRGYFKIIEIKKKD